MIGSPLAITGSYRHWFEGTEGPRKLGWIEAFAYFGSKDERKLLRFKSFTGLAHPHRFRLRGCSHVGMDENYTSRSTRRKCIASDSRSVPLTWSHNLIWNVVLSWFLAMLVAWSKALKIIKIICKKRYCLISDGKNWYGIESLLPGLYRCMNKSFSI